MTIGFSLQDALSDTIVARASAPGVGAIAVIRLSGPQALSIAEKAASGSRLHNSHRLMRAQVLRADGTPIDDGMLVAMHQPRSYTGEDTAEFYGHGSPAVVEAVVKRFIELGARLAGPGEFTYRAFVNGKIDLSQAEAVADLIASRSDAEHQAAMTQLSGQLRVRVQGFCEALETILATWRAEYDFPEYDHGAVQGFTLAQGDALAALLKRLETLHAGARLDLFAPQNIVLAGAPNVGKSTLLNALAGETRVLVHDAPGTTRDAVELEISRLGQRFRVWDTAGVRSGQSELERRGAELGLERAKRAEAVLWLIDPARPTFPPKDIDCFILAAKADLVDEAGRQNFTAELNSEGHALQGWISGNTGEGIDEIFSKLLRGSRASSGAVHNAHTEDTDLPDLVRERHVLAVGRAIKALKATLLAERQGAPLDVLAIELEQALAALGAILGRAVDTAVLDEIFSQFCIGK